MNKQMNTTYTFKFFDDTTTEMTLTFYALYQLKSKNVGLYNRYNKIMTKGASDELETLTVLYAGYVCANMNESELMSEEEFIIKCGCDREEVAKALKALTTPKKQ